MTRCCLFWVVLIGAGAAAAIALAGAPAEIDVQGLYEGSCKDAKGVESKLEVRVVAQGKGEYKAFIRQSLPDGKLAKPVLDGKTDGAAVVFEGRAGEVEWKAAFADGAIKGSCGQGCTLELKRVERKPASLGAKPPEGAIVLLPPDPKSSDEMTKRKGKDGTEPEWKVFEDGGVLVPKGGMSSKRTLDGSFKLHVEFKCPFMPAGRGQGRGNSGVYLPNGDEIQVLDSFGMDTYLGGGCGGIYKYKDPDTMEELPPPAPDKPPFRFTLASLPPGQWQTYDIEYRVPMQDGKPAGRPRVTVYHNGIKIHDNFELKGSGKRPFFFQDHGCPVQYRNIWVLPIEGK